MASLIIPFSGESSFIEEITLENTPYDFAFNWNSRGEFWELSIYDRDLNPLVLGIKLVLNEEFFVKFPDRGLPPGSLFIFDGTGSNEPISFEDFTNGRCYLIYVESI
jgi:hypothetical protein